MKKNRLLALLLAAVMTVSTTAVAFAATEGEEPTTPPASGTTNPDDKEEPSAPTTPDTGDKEEPSAPTTPDTGDKEEPSAPTTPDPGDKEEPSTPTNPDSSGSSSTPEDEGLADWTPAVDKATLHDASGTIADADLYEANSYSATLDGTTVKLAIKGLKKHQNAESADGYWVGFAATAPEKVGETPVAKVKYAKGADIGSGTVIPLEDLGNGVEGIAYYLNAATAPEDAKFTIQWMDAEGNALTKPVTFAIDLSAVEVASVTVMNEDELNTQLGESEPVITLGADIDLTASVNIAYGVTLNGNDKTVTAPQASPVARAAAAPAFVITAPGVELKDLKIAGAEAGEAAIQITGGSTELTNVEIVAGEAEVDNAAVTLGAGTKVSTVKMTDAAGRLTVEKGATVTKVNLDGITLASGETLQGVADTMVDNNTTSPIKVEKDGLDPVVVAPAPTPVSGDSSDNDYFGTATWDEVKRIIADAKDGDTIKLSGNGLKNFPASVARDLKGKDITLEIRKNGVTYSINGLEIGSVDKLWYEFENLEKQLLTVSSSKPANKPQNSNTVKPNPSTGR